jgi:hypothetical protein
MLAYYRDLSVYIIDANVASKKRYYCVILIVEPLALLYVLLDWHY